MYRHLMTILLLWLAISSGTATAQDGPTLVVALKDIDNKPVAGASVIVRDHAGDRDIATATTDSQGIATFATLNETDIRLAVQGRLAGGAKLYQPGNDARGMLVFLQVGTTHVNLLADTDGMIAPDPLTMSALEPGIPVATAGATVFPTALVAATPTATATQAIPQATFQAISSRAGAVPPAESAASAEAAAAPTNPALIWLGVGLLALLTCAGIGMVLLQRCWR